MQRNSLAALAACCVSSRKAVTEVWLMGGADPMESSSCESLLTPASFAVCKTCMQAPVSGSLQSLRHGQGCVTLVVVPTEGQSAVECTNPLGGELATACPTARDPHYQPRFPGPSLDLGRFENRLGVLD